ncbi:hypothetical protein RRG08_058780 [Elysia crispata]|uniref:Uncharacterized protein n=1 Tax=Elysia crispata TaxID=231223 RepID=A0AAE0YWR7_9GAST|nr:hypothetical protein RRG08_058780 [Elysia crispata]
MIEDDSLQPDRCDPLETASAVAGVATARPGQGGLGRALMRAQGTAIYWLMANLASLHGLASYRRAPLQPEPHESITTSFTTLSIYSDQNGMSRSPQASQLSVSIQIRTTRVDHHKLHNSHYLFRSEPQESITTSFTTLTIYSDQNHKSRSPQASQLSLSIQIRTT